MGCSVPWLLGRHLAVVDDDVYQCTMPAAGPPYAGMPLYTVSIACSSIERRFSSTARPRKSSKSLWTVTVTRSPGAYLRGHRGVSCQMSDAGRVDGIGGPPFRHSCGP